MNNISDPSLNPPRFLPVIVLADTSGSMEADDKISVLNDAIREMIVSFAEETSRITEIHVAVISFGNNQAKIEYPLKPASSISWQNLTASGKTPLGQAFDLARSILEDLAQISLRVYNPAIVLVSDGFPTDDWRGSLDKLLSSSLAKRLDRFAMAIGDDANINMLEEFLDNSMVRVFHSNESREIKKFFRWVTYNISERSRSMNPNFVEPTLIDDFEF